LEKVFFVPHLIFKFVGTFSLSLLLHSFDLFFVFPFFLIFLFPIFTLKSYFNSQEKATKWQDKVEMDGLTANGVLIMHPKGKFCGGNAKCGLWRETSLGGGEVLSLRESRSAQQKGQLVSITQLFKSARKKKKETSGGDSVRIANDFSSFSFLSSFSLVFFAVATLQIKDETNILQDGTLFMWRDIIMAIIRRFTDFAGECFFLLGTTRKSTISLKKSLNHSLRKKCCCFCVKYQSTT
jgi:Pellino